MSEEKQLPASSKRRQELREKGQVIRSVDISSTVLLSAGLFGLLAFGGSIANGMAKMMGMSFGAIANTPSSISLSTSAYYTAVPDMWIMVTVFLGLIFCVVLAVQLMQVGFLITTEPLNLNTDALNPLEGAKRLFSIRRIVQTLLTLVKLLVIGFFVYAAVMELGQESIFKRPVSAQELGQFFVNVAWAIGWRVLTALALIALVDYLYQWWQFENDHKMSVQEAKDELRQTEGSPEIKARQRALRRKRSVRRMLEDVADSTIVITNPTHYAVALKYKRGETPAPVVMAKGMRLIALRIKARAIELGIPVIENKPLARGLHKYGRVGDAIPVTYYQAVAGVLAQMLRRGFRSTPETVSEEEDHE